MLFTLPVRCFDASTPTSEIVEYEIMQFDVLI